MLASFAPVPIKLSALAVNVPGRSLNRLAMLLDRLIGSVKVRGTVCAFTNTLLAAVCTFSGLFSTTQWLSILHGQSASAYSSKLLFMRIFSTLGAGCSSAGEGYKSGFSKAYKMRGNSSLKLRAQ